MNKEVTGKRILVLAPNWVGDAAMCTPALRALRRHFPDAQLTAAGRASVCDLLEDLPWLDALIRIPERPSPGKLLTLAGRLRPHGRDIVVVFPHSFRAALLAWLIHGRERIGYARNGRSLLLTRTRAPYRENGTITPIYMAREYLELTALLGCEDDSAGLELGLSDAVTRDIDAQLARYARPLIGIAPGAAFGPSKRWMPEAFAATADLIADKHDASFLLLTGPDEESIRDAVIRHANVPFIDLNTRGAGLAALKAVIARLDLLICNDSGPRHIAVAFQRPVVCIMGPTSPKYSEGPYEIGERLQLPLPCSPCQQPECPLEHHRCMRDITPAMVAESALTYLQPADDVVPATAFGGCS